MMDDYKLRHLLHRAEGLSGRSSTLSGGPEIASDVIALWKVVAEFGKILRPDLFEPLPEKPFDVREEAQKMSALRGEIDALKERGY